jgi:hypothetical protein
MYSLLRSSKQSNEIFVQLEGPASETTQIPVGSFDSASLSANSQHLAIGRWAFRNRRLVEVIDLVENRVILSLTGDSWAKDESDAESLNATAIFRPKHPDHLIVTWQYSFFEAVHYNVAIELWDIRACQRLAVLDCDSLKPLQSDRLLGQPSFCPSGRYVLLAHEKGPFTILDADSLTVLWQSRPNLDVSIYHDIVCEDQLHERSPSISADGKCVAYIGASTVTSPQDWRLSLLRSDGHSCHQVIEKSRRVGPPSLAFTADGKHLVALSDPLLMFFESDSLRLTRQYDLSSLFEAEPRWMNFRVSVDSSLVLVCACVAREPMVSLWVCIFRANDGTVIFRDEHPEFRMDVGLDEYLLDVRFSWDTTSNPMDQK